MLIRTLSLSLLLSVICSTTQAHYLWVSVTTANNESQANVVFEESPFGGDGFYLGPIIKRGNTWVRQADSGKVIPLKMEEAKLDKERWVTATLPNQKFQTVESYVKWGVYKYGKTFALLHYYSKFVANGESEKAIELSDQLDLDYKLKFEEGNVKVGLFWKGKPVAGNSIRIGGPRFFQDIKTDKTGWATFHSKRAGQYRLRSIKIEANQAGEFEEKKHDHIRRCATLVINLAGSTTADGHTKDSLKTVKKNLEAKKAILLDVRELQEWQAGHIANAMFLPLSKLNGNIDEKSLNKELSKKKIIYTHCRSGFRSVRAGKVLSKYKYDVRPLKAGYEDLKQAGFK